MKIGNQALCCLVAVLGVCQCLSGAERKDESRKLQSQAEEAFSQGNYPAASRYWTKALRLTPDSAFMRWKRALSYYRNDETDKAIQDLDVAIRLKPTSNKYVLRGASYVRKHEHDRALADFNEAIRLDPKYALAFCNRADLELDLHKLDPALADYSEAIRLYPNFARAYFARAVVHFSCGDDSRAFADCSRAIAVVQEDPLDRREGLIGSTMIGAYSLRAQACARQGDREGMFADAKAATLTRPDQIGDISLRQDFADLENRAAAYEILGEFNMALRDFRAAIKLRSDDTWSNNHLAWYFATLPDERLRDGNEAVNLAKRACDASNWKSANCIDTLAAAYAENGEFDRAIDYESKAIGMIPVGLVVRDRYENRLKLYQQHQPFREEPKTMP